ncbi:indolepyruvate ferredoxin oxidoreductase family protein [Rhodopseudomonas sp. HC1]|uniref:indolepyruvate ferredoxin oxidoreductase family protein n=1 Tax=Rhodopseudomonas infernalis TaxID=2897386 RepID=UPI001EE860D7|nr:indolepyruvate ferredoxin oxidoreductase family protein [Rhodopseudomonas infernalis]MCG6205986.1 indolepyruvate ferredoxin oxidoreductase family protein [Rhodopseudomonas infernalis]
MNMPLRHVSLKDRYTQASGVVFLNGTQALVRLLLTQRERDRKAGLNTAGFVSGYRGSPLGGLDMELWNSKDFLKQSEIVFQPGLNEDLAATSVWGTQQIDSLPGRTVDGVFGMWYGKGPGVDRSGDPFKHGNYAGTTRHGGVLVVYGDDHPGKSSTVAHQSEQALAANLIPSLYPSNVQEILEYGLHGWAMSRFTGLWVGLKTVNETVETTSTIAVADDEPVINLPASDPQDEAAIRPQPDYGPQRDETAVIRKRLPRIHEYARANRLDSRRLGKAGARLGIVTSGKAYADLVDALNLLGIDQACAEAWGVSVYKVGLIWPLEPAGLVAFAEGCEELLFVEEKKAFLEDQAAKILFNQQVRPRLIGKQDEQGDTLLPSDIQLNPLVIAKALASRLTALGISNDAVLRMVQTEVPEKATSPTKAQPTRVPYFCSGCPHNSSTKVPEGSIAMSGIGCHSMAMWMNRDTVKPVQMGAEGANWIGLSHFTSTRHVFQNLGDGTYSHSGLLAIRASVLAGINITYKILANDAVAMTGGQPVEGALTTRAIVRQVLAEDVARVIVVTDDLDRTVVDIPGVDVVARDQLPRIQTELRDTAGTTVIVYEQVCAAEKRRRRKRKLMPDPPRRVFINEDVCEGCGDCSVQSNCVSIVPVDTELGRKRRIDQSSCNKDYSCVEGFCPSFVSVEGAKLRKGAGQIDRGLFANLPEAPEVEFDQYSVLITGVGGTGVVTIGSVLAMAANVAGKAANAYNMTGLAQKGGAVFSHLRIASSPDRLSSAMVGPESADLLLGCDLVAAASPDGLKVCSMSRTRAVLSADPTPTAAFQADRDYRIDEAGLVELIGGATDMNWLIDAGAIAEQMLGDRIGSNMFMVGYAYQRGLLPLPSAAIRKAIELNGAAVQFNLDAFDLGRLAVVDPAAVQARGSAAVAADTCDAIVAHRVGLLTQYQNSRWAKRYTQWVARVREAEGRVAPGSEELSRAVAVNLAKLMTYKDEYEVARLYAKGDWRARLSETFEGYDQLSVWLSPPLFASIDKATGRPKKMKFGPWIFTAFDILARLKGLRGTPLDPFGWTAERRKERELLADYETQLELVLARLDAANLPTAIELASLPNVVRGFGFKKDAAISEMSNKAAALVGVFKR